MEWQSIGLLALVFGALYVLVRYLPRGSGC